jgi:formate-dependent nitrite reductase membrane component NrfD
VSPGSGEQPVVPRADLRSYYGQPVVKPPVWTWEIPWYLFAGGLAGASAPLAYLAEARGNVALGRRAWTIALGALAASPALLVSDLGRPSRFLNMLRVVKVTSPMSVGSWLLAGTGAATGIAALNVWTGALPGSAAAARPAAALLGPPLATYTSALVSSTAVPVWREARWTLPFVFAGSAAASAGAAAAIATPARHAAPARRLALLGSGLETTASKLMERRLGTLGEPYRGGPAGRLARISDALTVVGGLAIARAERRRAAAVAGGGLVLAGAVCKRWSIFKAGFQSAADPAYTVGPQRRRIQRDVARGAERLTPMRET